MARVYIYVTGTDRERFACYAARFGLDVTALSNLLLERELRVGRLGNLRYEGGKRPRDEKITAHMSDSRRSEFASHAAENGLSISEAGAVLMLAELDEKWLEKAVDNL
jgi:hypothetical protein